jgi:PAS domain S-box-containing protein
MPVSIKSRIIRIDQRNYVCAIAQNPGDYQGETAELQDSNDRFRLLFEQADVGMARVAANGEFLQVNDAFCRLLGYSREEILAHGIPLKDVTLPEEIDAVQERHQQLLEGRIASFAMVTRYVQKGGGALWVSLSVSLLRDKFGTPTFFIGTALDISGVKKTEEFQKLALTVFADTHDGIIVTDLKGNIESVNPAFTVLTGYSKGEVIGRNPRLLKSGHHPPSFYTSMWAALKRKRQWRGEVWNRHKNGEVRPSTMTISTVTNSLGEAIRYVCVFSGISNSKESAERLNFLTHHDPLTGLANRQMLALRAEHALNIARPPPPAVSFADDIAKAQ